MYKDKDKQREANKKASQRRRDQKGMTQGMTKEGMTVLKKARQEDMTSGQFQELEDGSLVGDGYVPTAERTAQGNIRVSKPGDSDYVSESGSESGFDDETSPNHQHENTGLSSSPSGKIETSSIVQE